MCYSVRPSLATGRAQAAKKVGGCGVAATRGA